KTRIITRSRYRRVDLLPQGKCRCAFVGAVWAPSLVASPFPRERGRVRVHSRQSAYATLKTPHLAPLPLPKGRGENTTRNRRQIFTRVVRCVVIKNSHQRKTPPSGRLGQVKALDGVAPQPQDRQRLACVLQAFGLEVPCCTSDDVPSKLLRRVNRVGRLRCILIVLILFIGICFRPDCG